MSGMFRLVKTAPLSVRIRSRECCTYMNRVMKIVGWIVQKQGINRYVNLFWACLVFIFSRLYLPTGLVFSLLVDFKKFTPGEFLGIFQTSLNLIGATVKSIILLISITRLSQTNSILDILDDRLQKNSVRRIIHKAVAYCNHIFLVYGCIFLAYNLSAILAGILMRQPPFLIYNPFFNWREGVKNLWFQSVLEVTIMLLNASSILILDTFLLIFMIMFRAHFDVLKNHIRNLRTDPIKKESENYEELVGCVIYHKLILKCCYLMRPVFSRIIFIQFVLTGVVLGITLINVLYFSGILNGISSIIFLIAVLLETFPFCYLCDLLVEDCKDLSNLLAQSNWIDSEPKYKSTLQLFLHHLQQPITFNAGGIFHISMNTNIKVAKFAFSVMTLVQKMNLKERLK